VERLARGVVLTIQSVIGVYLPPSSVLLASASPSGGTTKVTLAVQASTAVISEAELTAVLAEGGPVEAALLTTLQTLGLVPV
jgi:hypothetical protein